MKNFNELSERELLALAISLEEEDERIYADFFEGLRQDFSRIGHGVRQHAKGRVGTPPPSDRTLSAEIWRAHTADSPAGRERIRAAHAGVAGAPAWARHCAQAGKCYRSRDSQVL